MSHENCTNPQDLTTLAANDDEPSTSRNATVPIASKQITDVIQFQEPHSSRNYSFKTEIRIDILGGAEFQSQTTMGGAQLTDEKETVDAEESYVTIEDCVKEKHTNTHEATVFSRNERTQRAIMSTSEPPPPYTSHPPPAYTSTPSRPPLTPTTRPQFGASITSGGNMSIDGLDSSSFVLRRIRHDFVRKVFFILTVQLLIVTGFVALAMLEKNVNYFVKHNMIMFIVTFTLLLVVYFSLTCYRAVRRRFPWNFVLLVVFTLMMAYVMAAMAVYFSTKSVLIAFASTALVTLVVSLLACQTRFDITKWTFLILIATLVLLVYGLIITILSVVGIRSRIAELVLVGVGVVLACVYLMYDMQCILGGRREELSPEEYIVGTILLFVDIANLFLCILQLIGLSSN